MMPSEKLLIIRRNEPISVSDFEVLTRSFKQLHPGFYPQWSTITARSLRQKIYTLEARWKTSDMNVGALAGVLSLVFMNSPIFGKHLISVPYVNVGGCIIPEGPLREKIETALVDEAVKLADELDVKYLELRNLHKLTHSQLNFQRCGKVLMELELPESLDTLWKIVGAKVRNQVRKGEKAGLRQEWGGVELIPQFYTVFAETMRNVGTPVYSRHLFDEMFVQLGDRAEICLVKTQVGRLASAAILVHGREITEVPSAGTLRWANASCANMFLYWHLLKHALENRHAKVFDFGRSTIGSGTWHFKKQWGAREMPVVWKYYVRKGSMDDVRPDNATYGVAIRIWKHLPVWLTRLIGPEIVRGIP